MLIKEILPDRRSEAIELVARVFMTFEAPDYSEEGIKAFFRTALYNEEYLKGLVLYGAYLEEKLVGVLATRNNGNHIALFFVEGKYHRQGIGRKLFDRAKENRTAQKMTVNASPYAKEVYHHLGFVDTDKEQTVSGIRFTPMSYVQ